MGGDFFNTYILIGCKGSGKSTQGRELASYLNLDFFDVDDVIKELSGLDARTLYSQKGVGAFMMAEEEACKKIAMENAEKNIVISTGGGVCDNAPALNVLRGKGQFVFLNPGIEASVDRVLSKVQINDFGLPENLPAYIAEKNPSSIDEVKKLITERFTDRLSRYKNIADFTVDLESKATKEENFKTILKALGK